MDEQKINKTRSLYYAMFSRFFIFSVDHTKYFELSNLINVLKENPLDDATGVALTNLSEVIKSDSNVKFISEFDDIFHSPESSTVRTTASYYDEQIESGKKRVEMQNFLGKTKIRRDEKTYTDYEDHVGFIFAVLSELAQEISDGKIEYKNTAHCIFEQILNDFVDEFAKELYEHENAVIFKDIVVVLNSFITLERLYLEVSKPSFVRKTQTVAPTCDTDEISDTEKERRARNKLLRAIGPKKQENESCPVHVAYEVEDDI